MSDPVRVAIYEALSSDATLTGMLGDSGGVYHQIAPLNAQPPYVIFNRQDGRPEWQFTRANIQQDLYLIKCVDVGPSASTAETVAARINDLIGPNMTITGPTLLAAYRVSDVDYLETVDTDLWRHRGSVFRVVTQPA